jgi:hypothetical protein
MPNPDGGLIGLARHLRNLIQTAKRDGRSDDDIADSLDMNIRATSIDAEKLGPLREPMLDHVRLMEHVRDRLLTDGAAEVIDELMAMARTNAAKTLR